MFLQEILRSYENLLHKEPSRLFMYDFLGSYSYDLFNNLILHLCSQFEKFSLKKGDRVAVLIPNSVELCSSLISIIYYGCVFVPISIEDPPQRIREILRNINAKALLYCEKDFSKIQEIPKDDLISIPILRAWLTIKAFQKPIKAPPNDDLQTFYITHTSGSTGAPKGVEISSLAVKNVISWSIHFFKINRNDILFGYTSPAFDLSVFHLIIPFLTGASVYLVSEKNDLIFPSATLKKATIALAVPRLTELIHQEGAMTQNAFSQLRHLIFCGEKLYAKQANLWLENNPNLEVHNVYGPCETTIFCTHFTNKKGEKYSDPIPIGSPIPNVYLEIDSSNNELLVGGVQVSAMDYLNKITKKFYTNTDGVRFYKTGDRVYKNSKGLFFWSGRIDNQIKYRGYRVEPEEIESIMNCHPEVTESVCLYNKKKQELILIFTPKREIENLISNLKQHASNLLPTYMRPTNYSAINKIPRNSNGKVNRALLAKIFF